MGVDVLLGPEFPEREHKEMEDENLSIFTNLSERGHGKPVPTSNLQSVNQCYRYCQKDAQADDSNHRIKQRGGNQAAAQT